MSYIFSVEMILSDDKLRGYLVISDAEDKSISSRIPVEASNYEKFLEIVESVKNRFINGGESE